MASKQRGRAVTSGDLLNIRAAERALRDALELAKMAGAHGLADKIRSARKSAGGALRNAEGHLARSTAPDTTPD